jgi:hypothetical protein
MYFHNIVNAELNCVAICEWWSGKDVEGTDHDCIRSFPGIYFGRAEETDEKSHSGQLNRDSDPWPPRIWNSSANHPRRSLGFLGSFKRIRYTVWKLATNASLGYRFHWSAIRDWSWHASCHNTSMTVFNLLVCVYIWNLCPYTPQKYTVKQVKLSL